MMRPGWWPDHRRDEAAARVLSERRARHPRFLDAVIADARTNAVFRGEPIDADSRRAAIVEACRLAVISDAFIAQVAYRAKAALQARGIPILPAVMHRIAIVTGQVTIGDPVIIEAGVYFPHGQVVIDGLTEVHRGAVIAPFATIGLKAGNLVGPTIERRVAIGTGARVLGPIVVGTRAVIGANAVVVDDVAANTTVVGVRLGP